MGLINIINCRRVMIVSTSMLLSKNTELENYFEEYFQLRTCKDALRSYFKSD